MEPGYHQKGRRHIWIEVIAPSPGDETNLDKVPDLLHRARQMTIAEKSSSGSQARSRPRPTSSYATGRRASFGLEQFLVVAIAASRFALEADAESGAGLPLPVTTDYPFGEEVITIDPETAEFTSLSHQYSGEIERAKRIATSPMPCRAWPFRTEFSPASTV